MEIIGNQNITCCFANVQQDEIVKLQDISPDTMQQIKRGGGGIMCCALYKLMLAL